MTSHIEFAGGEALSGGFAHDAEDTMHVIWGGVDLSDSPSLHSTDSQCTAKARRHRDMTSSNVTFLDLSDQSDFSGGSMRARTRSGIRSLANREAPVVRSDPQREVAQFPCNAQNNVIGPVSTVDSLASDVPKVPTSENKRVKPSKCRRAHYKRMVEQLQKAIEASPEAFDPDVIFQHLPNYVTSDPVLRQKCLNRLVRHQQECLQIKHK